MRNDWRKAAIEGDVATMRSLLAEGIDVDSRDTYGQTALMLAALHGRREVVDLLLQNDADLDVTAKYHLSALMLAVLNHHSEIARALVTAGANTGLRGSGAPGFSGKTAADLAEDAGLSDLAADLASHDGPTQG
jgi:ankyrin repeat protein